MCFREENNNGIRLSATKQLQQQHQQQNAKDVFYVFEVNNFFQTQKRKTAQLKFIIAQVRSKFLLIIIRKQTSRKMRCFW